MDEEIRLEGRVLNMGNTLAYTETKIFNAITGKILVTGLHTKFIGRSIDNPKNVKFAETGMLLQHV